MPLIWLENFNLLSIVTPRSTIFSTNATVQLFVLYWAEPGLPISSTLHFVYEIGSCHSFAHSHNLSRLVCNFKSILLPLIIQLEYSLTSFAYSFTMTPSENTLIKSLIYRRNKAGPRQLPWTTPLIIFISDKVVPIRVCCVRPVKNHQSTQAASHIPYSVLLQFLANVNSCSCSLYVVVRPSVVCLSSVFCLSSVCNVRAPYSGDWNFRQCFYAI